MINKSKKIELLAPAKNKECAIAAINAGADAVYIEQEIHCQIFWKLLNMHTSFL